MSSKLNILCKYYGLPDIKKYFYYRICSVLCVIIIFFFFLMSSKFQISPLSVELYNSNYAQLLEI